MGWLSRRSAGARAVEEAAAERLERLARQWRPIVPEQPSEPDDLSAAPLASDAWRSAVAPDDEREVRTGPWTAGAVRALLLLLAVALAATGWWWWSGRPREIVTPAVVVATGMPLATTIAEAPVVEESGPPADVVVHVTGQVAHPGLVRLPAGSRVSDAVLAAGGVTRPRAADTVNLARVVVDGEQIVVGGSAVAAPPPAPSPSPQALDLNTADSAALQGLPGVGPVLAGRILEWRLANGAFRSVDELGEVSGIGEATLARMRPLVRV